MTTPRRIGRYEIIEEIGRGAMGIVYLAHDPRIDRRVALKTLHALDVLPAADAEEIRQRFTREAQAAGSLQHPGIVTIFDVGEHEGTCYIAMEYIEGETLEDHTRPGTLLPLRTVVDLIVQACDALDCAHQQNIVHRDIKPANLMLLRNGRLKITDFGLAKNPRTNLTQEGILIGTPNYMSPEQVKGEPLDGRSDLFSLGAVLYELLTGERPFPGDTVTTIIYRILNERPREPRQINERIPAAIGTVLMKALARDPAKRYQTGAELGRALQGRAVAVASAAVGTAALPSSMGYGSIFTGGREEAAEPPLDVPRRRAPGRVPPPSIAGGGVAARPRGRPGPVAWAAPRAGVLARARGAFIVLGALAAVVLAPAAVTIDDRWGRGDAGGKQPFHRSLGGAAPTVTAAAAGPPSVTLPGAETVTLLTDPPGGRIYVDDVEAAGGVVSLPAGDRRPRSVVAENDCFIEKTTWNPGTGARPAGLTIRLRTPKVSSVPVSSTPPGARILLDGRDTGLTTPADVAVTACAPHVVALRLEGYKDVTGSIGEAAAPLALTLGRIPYGRLAIETPYPVEIYEKGKRIGAAGETIRLPSGRHTLTLKNDELFVERTLAVTVPEDRTVAPKADLPGTGRLTVLASPSNCRIYINGRDIGPPPINDYRLAAGTYAVRAVYVPTGDARETNVTVTAGAGARVPFKFTP